MTIAELESELAANDEEHTSEECHAFDGLLRTDLKWLQRIRSNEEMWQKLRLEKKVGYSPEFEELLLGEYKKWLDHAKRRLRQLEMQEEAECLPETANEFRIRVEEVEDALQIQASVDAARRAHSEMWNSEKA